MESEWHVGGRLAAARYKWGLHHDDDLLRLRLAVNVVGATRQTHSFQLLESIQTRLLTDIVGPRLYRWRGWDRPSGGALRHSPGTSACI